MTKKATEVILELQEQVKHLTRIVANQDNNIKLIIKKLNSMKSESFFDSVPEVKNVAQATVNNMVSKAESGPVSSGIQVKHAEGQNALALKAQHAKQQVSQFDQMKAQAGITDEPDDILSGVARRQDSDESDFNLQEATQFSGKVRGQRVGRESSKNSKISVTQQLFDHDGKPLPLATVKITNQFGQPVKSARSSVKGKWNAPLDPGNYEVHVLRKFVADPSKKPVEYRYSISVPNSEGGRLEIPPPNLEG